jgi:hypothetical protein
MKQRPTNGNKFIKQVKQIMITYEKAILLHLWPTVKKVFANLNVDVTIEKLK